MCQTLSGSLRRDDADLGQMATQPIEQLRALRDQHLPRLVMHQHRLVLQREGPLTGGQGLLTHELVACVGARSSQSGDWRHGWNKYRGF